MEFIREVLGIVSQYYSYLLSGVGYTLLIALIGTAAGFLIGLLTGVIRTAPKSKNAVLCALHKIVNAIIAVYIEVFRGTPMMVQAMVIYWGYAFLNDGATLPLIPAGLFIVSINTGAYMAEIVRGGIISVDKGQLEGAYSVGMTHGQAMVKVVIPQVLQNILPSISNEFVINIKDTSVMFIIGFIEFFGQHRNIVGNNNMYFQSAAIEMIGYLTMTLIASFLLRRLEKWLDGSSSYELVQDDALTMAAGTYSHPSRGTPFDERSPEGALTQEQRERKRQELKHGRSRGER